MWSWQRAAMCAVGSDNVEAFRTGCLVAPDLGGLDPSHPGITTPARRSPPPELGRALKERGEDFRDGVEVATLDPFHGYKNAIDDQLEDAVAVLDAFHVVKVRHEALCVRMEVRDLHRLVVAAAGLKLRAA